MRRNSNRAPRGGGAPTLSDGWRAWVTENALRSVPREELLATLSANGVPRKLGEREMDAILASPLFAGATRVSNRAKRRELRARLERETALLAREPRAIERRSGVSPEEFFDRYYATGTPVVLTDTFATWPTLAGWSPSAFRERIGHTEVSATSGRASDPASHTHFGKDCAVMAMADLCDRVVAAGRTNDFYLISNDFRPNGAGISPLLADVRAPHPYLDDQRDVSCVILWFGPAGTVTPLHHDTKNVLLCQVFGTKRVLLFPRFETPLLGARPDTVYSPIDIVHPEGEAFRELGDALRKESVLCPGEALFIPVGCFHQLRALEPSISLGFSNFRRKNAFGWYTPGKIE